MYLYDSLQDDLSTIYDKSNVHKNITVINDLNLLER
jgi:hypothetical protein